MFRRFMCCLAIIVVATLAAAAPNVHFGNIRFARPAAVPAAPPPGLTVLLVPLDSRPPCTQFVEQLGGLAGVRVVLPPAGLLDNYRTPADRAGLRDWLRRTAPTADAAIVSVDMLTHGSLLASRRNAGTAADAEATVALLAEVHRANPRLKIYAFNIIPRLLPSDDGDVRYQQQMMEFSMLKDTVLAFENPLERDRLAQLAREIPPVVASRYQALYEAHTQLNLRLVALVEEGVLAGLVIGQDDGFPFGLPNMVKNRLNYFVSHRPNLSGRVFITRGTDEVALSLLGQAIADMTGFRPKVFVEYSHAAVPGTVMPYMPHSAARTVAEKVALAGGTQVGEAGQADFVLFVHIGTFKTGRDELAAYARRVDKLVSAGHRVAVVDLSEHFYASETLLPYLLSEGVNLTRLAAYAGWNTTSNSVGTAVTQGALFVRALAGPEGPTAALYKQQLEFLAGRMLDDWYYQKEIQPLINRKLRNLKIDPYNLGDDLAMVDRRIGRLLSERADELLRRGLAGRTLPVKDGNGREYVVAGLRLQSRLPWQRTFEVWVAPTVELAVMEK